MAFSPETFALLMGKIQGLASGISSVAVGSNKQSLVFTTTKGTTVTVSIPNPINTVELCNKLSIDASNHLLYDGKRIAEYAEIPTATSQLTNDSGFITSANLPNLTPYQPKNDTTLNTTNKTVVGAINELKTNINNINVPTKTSQLTNDSGYIINSDIPTIPTKVSQLTNDSNYVTQIEMTDAIADAVTGGTVDLTGYQKSNDTNLATIDKTIVGAINELKEGIDNFEGGSGEGLTNEQKQQLADAYAHSQSPHVSASDIPTNVSELNNDSGYLTTNDIIIPTKVSDLTNDSNFINKNVNDLTNYPTTTTIENTYAKKTDIPTIPTKVSQLSNDSGFITSIPAEYVTDTELNAKGYLTEHQDISELQPKSDTDLTTTNKTIVGGINEVKVTADNKSKIITLTESQYKALSNLDPETYYITTDDSINISTTIDVSSTDKEVPSAKVVYTELNKKFNKTDIVDNLTSTNIDKPLSANQGKMLKDAQDSHIGDTVVHMTQEEKNKLVTTDNITTTIDFSSTNDTVPGTKTIFDNCIQGKKIDQSVIDTYGTEILKYPLGRWAIMSDSIAEKFTDLPISRSGVIDITSISYDDNNPWSSSYAYRVYSHVPYTGGSYVRKLEGGSTVGIISDTGWQRVCTTKVKDVDWAKATATSKLASGIINYRVKDGICYVRCSAISSTTMSTPNEVLAKGMPIPEQTPDAWQSLAANNDSTASPFQNLLVRITPTGDLINYIGTNGAIYFGTFSYLVAES